MKNLVTMIGVVCLAVTAQAQNLTTVTAANLYKGGVLLSSGQICFTGTDANDNPIPFRVGGGGQEVTFPYCATVTNGAIAGTFQVANPANTAPANISYRVELFDQYNRLQKWSEVQFTGASFNFDNYVPSANLPLGTSANVVTIGNLTVTGSCTGCGGGGGGGGGGYSTIESSGSSLAQRLTLNFFNGLTCGDNSGQGRTDCQLGGNVPESVTNDTNVTGSIASNVLALGWTGTLAKTRTLSATVYADQANTYSAGQKQIFGASATTAGEAFAGVSADPSTLANGDRWYRTDLKHLRFYDGSAARSLFNSDDSLPTSQLSGTIGNGQLANSYSGIGTCSAHQWASTLNGNAAPSCSQPAFGDLSGSASVSQLPGVGAMTVNGTTCTLGSSCTPYGGANVYVGSHTVAASDIGKLVVMNCSSACTLTFKASPASTDWFGVESIGSTTATLSLNSLNYNGGASVPTLNSYRDLRAWSDGSNYFGDSPLVAGTNVTLTPASNGITIAASGGGGASGYKVESVQSTPVTCDAGSTCGNTETALMTWSSPASELGNNQAYRITCSGTLAATGSPNLDLRLRYGGVTGTVLVAGQWSSVSTSGNNENWTATFIVIANAAPGSTAAVEAQGTGMLQTPSGSGIALASGGLGYFGNTSTVSIATNATNTIALTAQWTSATAGNSITQREMLIERLN